MDDHYVYLERRAYRLDMTRDRVRAFAFGWAVGLAMGALIVAVVL